ncbi:hypothetical protein R6Q59_002444 [Mikania micrantha]
MVLKAFAAYTGDMSDQHLLDDTLEDELEDNDWQSNRRARSPKPVFNDSDSKSRPRKRLIKKSTAEESVPDFGMDDDVEDVAAAFVRDDSDSGGGKRKKFSGDSGSGKKREKKFSSSNFSDRGGRSSDKGGSKFKGNGKRSGHSGRVDAEVKEMWETVAGGDSEVHSCLPHLRSYLISARRASAIVPSSPPTTQWWSTHLQVRSHLPHLRLCLISARREKKPRNNWIKRRGPRSVGRNAVKRSRSSVAFFIPAKRYNLRFDVDAYDNEHVIMKQRNF